MIFLPKSSAIFKCRGIVHLSLNLKNQWPKFVNIPFPIIIRVNKSKFNCVVLSNIEIFYVN